MQRSFIKNVKERKECNLSFIKNVKERENASSLEKNECPTLGNWLRMTENIHIYDIYAQKFLDSAR